MKEFLDSERTDLAKKYGYLFSGQELNTSYNYQTADQVRTILNENVKTERIGYIIGKWYHDKEQSNMYYLMIDGQKYKKRYFEKDLELAKQKVVEQLTSAKKEAASIIDQANKRAIEIVEEAKEKARLEGDRLKASAQAEIEQATSRAREELRSKVGTLALAGAEKILESSIDQNAHNELVNKLAAEL